MQRQQGMWMMHGRDASSIQGATLDRRVIRRIWRFARPYRSALLVFFGVIVVEAVLSLAPPLLFREILDNAIPHHDGERLNLLAGLIVGSALLDAGMSLAERWCSSRIGEGLIFDLRVALFDHVQDMPVSFFTRSDTGALTSRLSNDVLGAQRAVSGTMGSVVSNSVALLANGGAILFLDWRLALISLFVLPLFLVPAKRVGRRLQALTRRQMQLNASMSGMMTERFNVSGALLVKLFGDRRRESETFSADADGLREVGVRSAVIGATFYVVLGLIGALAAAAVYLVGGHQVISGDMTAGTLVALAVLVTRIYAPLTALTNARVDVMSAIVSFERVFEVLDAPSPITDRPGAVDLVDPVGRIELDHVVFAYDEQSIVPSLEPDHAPEADPEQRTRVLDGVDAAIEPGQMVALVGPSGAGKSTLASLLPRLHDVTEGAVRIDGMDVRDLTQDSLRRAIGVVSQDPHLFHDTIAGNLTYARPDATVDELWAAARAAQIDELVASLPDGMATLVGDRGHRLSGGEKQRIAIARMLLKDPAIVILDEATSHLDAENEALVQEALATALAGRTSIVIAHRLSTIVEADLILVVDEGRIVQRGTHAELLRAGGLYADLYRTLLRGEAGSPVRSEA
jgi:ATP-binding cassette subfamily B protein